LSTWVTVLAAIMMVGSILAGIVVALVTGTDSIGLATHTYAGVGVAIAVGGIFEMLVVLMFAQWARTYAVSKEQDFA
jgi:hypothetical protein